LIKIVILCIFNDFSCAQNEVNVSTKALRIVVPATAGGNNDLIARLLSQKINENMGQVVIVDNRPSASGLLSAQFVARSVPDGYTLLHASNTFAVAPSIVANAGYDPLKDFYGVTLTCIVSKVLDVNPMLSVHTVLDLIALAKLRPGLISYGTAGIGGTGHMAAELFNSQAGTRMLHVPYKGNSQAIVDVAGGQVMVMFDEISTSLSYIRSGKLRALAITSLKRSPILPMVPTIDESGLPGYEDLTFNGLMAPVAAPKEILSRWRMEVAKVVNKPELRKQFLDMGVELIASNSTEDFTAFIKTEFNNKAKLARQAGIKIE
jgi:tripartite-type tricarboxylate transporter receptor subunit TctC